MQTSRTRREIEATARWFEIAYLPRTAFSIQSLVGKDLRADTRWHAAVVDVYRSEIGGSLNILGEPDPEYHDALLRALDRLVVRAAGQMEPFLGLMLRSRQTLERIGESHGNTREMYRSFIVGEPSTKHTYLNVCLMYLILCEGLFAPQARFLLAVDRLCESDEAHRLLTGKIKPLALAERLASGGLGAFATGYHRHIRNSVAHGHFNFDQKTESMRFRDYKPDSQDVVFDERWPFQQMASLFAKLDDTYLVNASFWQVHLLTALAY